MLSNSIIKSENVTQGLRQTAQFMTTNVPMSLLIHPLTIKVNQVQTAGLVPVDVINTTQDSLAKKICRRYVGLQTTMLGVMARSAGTVNYPMIQKHMVESINHSQLATAATITATSSLDTLCGAYPSNVITLLVTKHQQQFQQTLKACQSRWQSYGQHLQLGTMGLTSRFVRNWLNCSVLIAVFPVMKTFYAQQLANHAPQKLLPYANPMASAMATVSAAVFCLPTNALDVIHRARIAMMQWQVAEQQVSARSMQIAPFFKTTNLILQEYGWRRLMAGADKNLLCTIIVYSCINGVDYLFNKKKSERSVLPFFKPRLASSAAEPEQKASLKKSP